jgi:hypothetical protein
LPWASKPAAATSTHSRPRPAPGSSTRGGCGWDLPGRKHRRE